MFDPDAHIPRINRGMVYLGACLIAGIRLARQRQASVRGGADRRGTTGGSVCSIIAFTTWESGCGRAPKIFFPADPTPLTDTYKPLQSPSQGGRVNRGREDLLTLS